MGQRVLDGEAVEGWFIPYRYADTVDERQPHRGLLNLFESQEARFTEILGHIAACKDALLAIGTDDPAPGPRWNQDWFAGLDAAAAYAMVCAHRPKRIIEVGSGHSTRFMLRAIQDAGIDTAFTAIDPAPRADISQLPVTLVPDVVQDVPSDLFDDLQAGDILFIDSSHILMPGTDVDMLFSAVIPALRPGVLVHIHDIFLPFPYPEEWTLRGYNEQNALAPLIAGGVLSTLLPCQYAMRRMAKTVASTCGFFPRPCPNHDASIWLVKA